MNLLVFEHVSHTNTKLPTVFTLLGVIFYAYLVDKGMSEMDAPESAKERLGPAGYSNRQSHF